MAKRAKFKKGDTVAHRLKPEIPMHVCERTLSGNKWSYYCSYWPENEVFKTHFEEGELPVADPATYKKNGKFGLGSNKWVKNLYGPLAE